VVNGKAYKILDGYHYISRSFLIREDVSAQKVYLLFLDGLFEKFEYLLYDFSLQVGDTFEMKNPISPFPPEPGAFICDSIVMRPLVNGNLYKHFYFHPIDSVQAGTNIAVWVEGVGSLSLINAPGGDPDMNATGELTCFFKQGISFYESENSLTKCSANFTPNSVNPANREITQIIYHWETGNLLVNTNLIPYRYRILDSSGRVVCETSKVNSENHYVDLSNLSKGIYIMEITDPNGSISGLKIVH
jgi:hypothetical protein